MHKNRRKRSVAFQPGTDLLEGRQLLSAASIAMPSTTAEIRAAAAKNKSVAQGTLKGTYRIDPPPAGTADLPNTVVIAGAGKIKGPGGESIRVQMTGNLTSGGFIPPNAIQNGEIVVTTPFGNATLAVSGKFSKLVPGGKATANASIISGTGSLANLRGIGTIVISLGANKGSATNPTGSASFVFSLRAPSR